MASSSAIAEALLVGGMNGAGIAYLRSPDNRSIFAITVSQTKEAEGKCRYRTWVVTDGRDVMGQPEQLSATATASLKAQIASRIDAASASRPKWIGWVVANPTDEPQAEALIRDWIDLTRRAANPGFDSTPLLIGGGLLLAFLLLRGRK